MKRNKQKSMAWCTILLVSALVLGSCQNRLLENGGDSTPYTEQSRKPETIVTPIASKQEELEVISAYLKELLPKRPFLSEFMDSFCVMVELDVSALPSYEAAHSHQLEGMVPFANEILWETAFRTVVPGVDERYEACMQELLNAPGPLWNGYAIRSLGEYYQKRAKEGDASFQKLADELDAYPVKGVGVDTTIGQLFVEKNACTRIEAGFSFHVCVWLTKNEINALASCGVVTSMQSAYELHNMDMNYSEILESATHYDRNEGFIYYADRYQTSAQE